MNKTYFSFRLPFLFLINLSYLFSQELITVVVEKYDNGNPKEEIIRKIVDDYNQPIVKKIIYCENGDLSEVSEVSDGLLHGIYQKYNRCGYDERFVIESINYKKGKKHGIEKQFLPTGQKSYEANYIEDAKNGFERKFDNNGMLTSEISYDNGKIIGETFTFSSEYVSYDKYITKKLYKTYDNGLWDCSMRLEILSAGYEEGRQCYSMVFPVKYTMPDKSIMTIEKPNQLKNLNDWYYDNELEIFDLIKYPVSFNMPDGSKIIIDAKNEIIKIEKWIRNNRQYKGKDVEFVFPVSLNMPDKSKIIANNRDELNNAENFYENTGHKIRYPIKILYETETEDVLISVNNDEELETELKKCESYNKTENYPRQLLERYGGYYKRKTERQMEDEKYDPSDYNIYDTDYFSSPDYHCDSKTYTKYGSKQGGYFIKNGLYESWFENGEKYHTRYIQNDKLKEKMNYIDGKINGLFQKWYDNGNKELDINYTDDQINGLYQSWFYNGQKKVKSNFSKDVLHGDFEEWHENGTQIRKMKYNYGDIDSIDKKWNANNDLVWEKNYNNGQLIEYKIFSTSGTLLIEKSIGITSSD